jgi:hypothetical protein
MYYSKYVPYCYVNYIQITFVASGGKLYPLQSTVGYLRLYLEYL